MGSRKAPTPSTPPPPHTHTHTTTTTTTTTTRPHTHHTAHDIWPRGTIKQPTPQATPPRATRPRATTATPRPTHLRVSMTAAKWNTVLAPRQASVMAGRSHTSPRTTCGTHQGSPGGHFSTERQGTRHKASRHKAYHNARTSTRHRGLLLALANSTAASVHANPRSTARTTSYPSKGLPAAARPATRCRPTNPANASANPTQSQNNNLKPSTSQPRTLAKQQASHKQGCNLAHTHEQATHPYVLTSGPSDHRNAAHAKACNGKAQRSRGTLNLVFGHLLRPRGLCPRE